MAEMSPLRRRMIEDMTVRNLSPATQRSYLHAVTKFSRDSPIPMIEHSSALRAPGVMLKGGIWFGPIPFPLLMRRPSPASRSPA